MPGINYLSNVTETQELALVKYAGIVQESIFNTNSLRGTLEEVDRAYMREMDYTAFQMKAKQAILAGDPTKISNVTVPIVMPQVESSLGYFINVFLTGWPIFGISGNPEVADAALMLDTIVGENQVTAGWIPELIEVFRDGLKYNICAVECEWGTKNLLDVNTDLRVKDAVGSSVRVWRGNTLKRIDMYNAFFDNRVPVRKIHERGEFFGYSEILSHVELLRKLEEQGIPISENLKDRIFSSSFPGVGNNNPSGPFTYYIPYINPRPFNDTQRTTGIDWSRWAGLDKESGGKYPANACLVTRLYARIIPKNFNINVPGSSSPQLWKIDIVNGQIICNIEKLSAHSNTIPVFVGQPYSDGLNLQTKSFASNVMDYQALASALWNGFLASKRRLVGDRLLYDPSRVSSDDINNPNPVARIPVRPSAYGRPIQDSVYAFPYRDEQSASFLQGSEAILRLANLTNMQNPAQQGQFVKGNKTLREYEDVMGHGNAGNFKMALSLEYQMLVPLKEAILLNMLLYQQQTTIYNPSIEQTVAIKPEEIRKVAVQFKVSDGLMPTDKLMSADEYGMFFQLLGAVPQLAQEYKLSPMVSYLLKLKNVDLRPFQKTPEEVQYEQQMAQWQQMAVLALEKGGTFNTPQPTPPPQQQPQTSLAGQALRSTRE